MTMLRVKILTPSRLYGQNTVLLISKGSCKVGTEYIDMKPESAVRGELWLHKDNTVCDRKDVDEGSKCQRKHTRMPTIFLEENDGAPGTEWRFEIIKEAPRGRKRTRKALVHTDGSTCDLSEEGCKKGRHYLQ